MSRVSELSIIIPARNEEHTITSVLRSLSRQARISDCEVIVVDGRSSDDTIAVASSFPFVRVVSCEPNRAKQMTFGAAQASAPALWFLHADSTLPDTLCVDHLLQALEEPEVVGGAFRFHLRGHDTYFRIVNGLVNLGSRVFRRTYGDQGIFVRTNAFRELGGFRDLGVCEDVDLVIRLRKIGRFMHLRQVVETSARTWQRHGKLPTTFFHLKQMFSFELRRVAESFARRKQRESEEPDSPEAAEDAEHNVATDETAPNRA